MLGVPGRVLPYFNTPDLASAVVGFTAAELSDLTATPESVDEGLVQQHMKDEVDVNTIVRRFGITGQLPLGPNTGIYGDFTDIFDYDGAVERVRGARERFLKLPAEVREKFDNDPGKLIALAQSMPEVEFNALVNPPAVVAPPVVP